MHEFGLTKRIVAVACEKCGGKRVAAINLVVGRNTAVMMESVELYFDIFTQGTACEGAALNVERVTPMLRCEKCGALFERKPFLFDCPCGGQGRPTDIGQEFYVKSIEVCDE